MNQLFKLLILIHFSYFYSLASTNIEEQTIDKLSEDTTWLKLLHYKNNKSDLLNKDFFLSKNGNINPKEELRQTIKSYYDTSIKKDDSHPRCKYPARYYWLSKNIKLQNYQVIEPYCKALDKWDFFKNTDSVSLMLVSGYLGNPASTFGHSFVKLNTKNNTNDLFNLSINYGALVPNNEPIIKYIFKGILGGYEAGFSDKYFYTQDLIYSHTEFRDMWEYKLNLSKEQKELYILHFWEIIGKKFKYYFLSENCAYKVSESLELITDEKFISKKEKWYAPIETFNTLEESNKPLINSINYIPSQQRVIYAKYNLLPKEEKDLVTKAINNNLQDLDELLNKTDTNSKIETLNFLLDYYKYLIIKEPKNKEYEETKNKILLKRLLLPIKEKTKENIKDLKSPAKGNKPILVKTGLSKMQNKDYYNTLGFSIFALEEIGDNNLEFAELVVADTQIGYKFNKSDLFLDSFDLIRIKKLKTNYLDWNEDINLSWKLNIGAKLDYSKYKDKNFYTSFVNASLGRAYKINQDIYTYMMIDTKAKNRYPYIEFTPNINLDFAYQNLKTSLSYGYKLNPYNTNKNDVLSISSQYKVTKDFSLFGEHKKDEYDKTQLSFKWFF